MARAGLAIRRSSWPAGEYFTARPGTAPPPSNDGEVISIWIPTDDDKTATDYEAA
ncbi:MAG: hypothetical protein ACPGVG_13260 [Mycobacterium sp.]